jgi:hypothetical protein
MTIPQSFAFGKIQPGYPFVVFDDISPDRGIFFAQWSLKKRHNYQKNLNFPIDKGLSSRYNI